MMDLFQILNALFPCTRVFHLYFHMLPWLSNDKRERDKRVYILCHVNNTPFSYSDHHLISVDMKIGRYLSFWFIFNFFFFFFFFFLLKVDIYFIT